MNDPIENSFTLSSIRFHAGIRINYAPHAGTYLILACTFLLAKQAARGDVESEVRIQALDHTPILLIGDSLFGLRRPLYFQSSRSERLTFLKQHYEEFLRNLSQMTGVHYRVTLYSDDQSEEGFRNAFLRSLASRSALRWSVSPFHALIGWKEAVGIRFPCPKCGLSTIYGETTRVIQHTLTEASFELKCEEHGIYQAAIRQNDDVILDLQKIMRNILKEVQLNGDPGIQHRIVKGSDWIPACSLVDSGIRILGFRPLQRVYLPVVTTDAGVKLSKSGIHQNHPEFANLPDRIAHPSGSLQGKDATGRMLRFAGTILSSDDSSPEAIPFTCFNFF